MANKFFFGIVYAGLIMFNCLPHGHCVRDICGKVITTENFKNVRISICECFGACHYPDCDSVSLNENGEYVLPNVPINAQMDCNNDCKKGEPTMPDSIKVKVIFKRIPIDSLVNDTTFSCAQGYTFSGDDIHLPDITIP